MPSVVGQDLGCGMLLANVKGRIKDLQTEKSMYRMNLPIWTVRIDKVIRPVYNFKAGR